MRRVKRAARTEGMSRAGKRDQAAEYHRRFLIRNADGVGLSERVVISV
jgi:hypothetical protein